MPVAVRHLFALLAGLVLGGAVNMGLVMLGPVLIPPPEHADLTTAEGLKAAMPLMQPRHFLFPFLAHALGTLSGAWLAARLSPRNPLRSALIVGGLFMAGGLVNVFILPSPLWFNALDLGLAYLPMAWAGARWSRKA